MSFEYIDKNVSEVKDRIESAKLASGRQNDDVMLLAAVKYAEPCEIEYLYRHAGITHVGENRVQQLLAHREAIDCEGLDFHFIGTLQTNKVKYIIDKVSMIHSLDSIKLACEIDKQAKKHGIVMDVFVEINSGAEESKSGVLPEDLESFCAEIESFENINHRGFMTMAPKCEKKEEYLKYFQQTYQQVLDIWAKKRHNISKPIISMGMSDSFEEAILCGSDIVRVGRRLFIR
ncbi:MAG: YggS family pyridoxal phosphate-dependent enzyme [Ruminococcaceae bacterium]|nr:YggS family pyridoxal phosphate-dependent enzyme [Oscillospiraceae bacterium]